MKIFLSVNEKMLLKANNSIVIERKVHIPCPAKSILHGSGIGVLFDKIDYKWIYGDVEDYIIKMTNVGRRGIDYRDNAPNTCSGGRWWSCKGQEKPYGEIGATFSTGTKNVCRYKISEYKISELRTIDSHKYDCLDIVLSITITPA